MWLWSLDLEVQLARRREGMLVVLGDRTWTAGLFRKVLFVKNLVRLHFWGVLIY